MDVKVEGGVRKEQCDRVGSRQEVNKCLKVRVDTRPVRASKVIANNLNGKVKDIVSFTCPSVN